MNEKLLTSLHKAWTEPRHFFLWVALLSLLGFGALVAISGLSISSPMAANFALACALCFLLSMVAFVLCWIPPVRSLLGRTLGRRFLALGCVVTLLALFYAVEDWRGRRAWQAFQSRNQAKGERFDFAGLIPPAVPADQNFFETPLWSDLHFIRTNGTVLWSDTNWGSRVSFNAFGPKGANSPSTGNWTKSQRVDLAAWQSYYRSTNNVFAAQNGLSTNYFPVSESPQSPAADVLLALSRFDQNRQLLITAAARPEARFWINYDGGPAMLIPHLPRVKGLAQYLSLHANAALKTGDRQTALEDLGLAFRLVDSLRDEPILISHLVRIAVLQILLQPAWEGLAAHQWSPADLASLESQLGKLDFLADYQRSMRGERACSLWAIDYIHREGPIAWEELAGADGQSSEPDELGRFVGAVLFQLVPSGWFEQNKVATCRLYADYIFPVVDESRHVVSCERAKGAQTEAQSHDWGVYNILSKRLVSFGKASERFARAQTSADQARVACALERYRLANGSYPDALIKLVPQFMPQLPPDVINGTPLKYRLGPDQEFILYSVGWNETDDEGKVALTKYGGVDMNKGDWTWQYPQK